MVRRSIDDDMNLDERTVYEPYESQMSGEVGEAP